VRCFGELLVHLRDGHNDVAQAMRDGSAQLRCHLTEELLQVRGAGPDLLHAYRQLQPLSAMSVPLRARDRLLGTLSFGSGADPAFYDETDLELAKQLALRAGMALEKAELYRSAQRSIAVREEFISVASHELLTPLTSLKLRLQLLQRRRCRGWMPTAEKLDQMFAADDQQVDRLVRLVDDMLDTSRIDRGQLVLRREPVDLAELAEAVTRRFGPQLEAAHVVASFEAEGPVCGRWDRDRLDQVVTNLLSNALKYGAGRPVAVRVRGDATHAWVAIRDHGMGIAPHHQVRVFERFERAVSGRSISGLGLGLHIVRSIVTAHGGTVSLKSAVGEGATFTVRLPLS
jgi:signal transduction histidine kinase